IFFSMGSATWVCISFEVAPGHITETLTTFTVKNGSSARPSFSYEKKPATPSTIIRNRTSVGWLTAQADRLKRFIARSAEMTQLPKTKLVEPSFARWRGDPRGWAVLDRLAASALAFARRRKSSQRRKA